MTRKPNDPSELIPMKLEKHYRPMGEFLIQEIVDGEIVIREPANELEPLKVPAGFTIHVPRDEASRMKKLKIAVREDDL